MSRRRRIVANVWAMVAVVVMASILTTSSVQAYDLVSDADSGCAVGGTITHDVSGDVLLIDPDSDLELVEVSVSELARPFDPPSGILYKIRVFDYVSSDVYGPYFGRGFTLYLFAREGGPWELDGSGVFHFYEPASVGDVMYMKGRLPLTGNVEGLAVDGRGGHVTGHLKPADPRAALAAYYTVDLEIQCQASALAA